jgi:hypothetical protein
MTTPQRAIAAAATVLHAEATEKGRAWGIQGIHAAVRGAIEEDGRQLGQVVIAGFAAIADEGAKTPAAIRWESRYSTAVVAGRAVRIGPTCAVCGRAERGCRHAAAISGDPHVFSPVEPRRLPEVTQ